MEEKLKKQNKAYKAIILVLMVLVVILGGLFVYKYHEDFLNNNSNNSEIDNKEKEIEEKNNISISDKIVSDSLALIGIEIGSNSHDSNYLGTSIIEYLLDNDRIDLNNIKEIDGKEFYGSTFIRIVLKNTEEKIDLPNNHNEINISKSIIDNSINKTFGKIIDFGKIIFYPGYSITLNNDNSKYIIKHEGDVGDNSIIVSILKITNASIKNNKLIINAHISFEYPEDLIAQEYKDRYSKEIDVEFTYKKESNSNYYFESIEKK